jgi:hypothetical protein
VENPKFHVVGVTLKRLRGTDSDLSLTFVLPYLMPRNLSSEF